MVIYTDATVDRIPQLAALSPSLREEIQVAAKIFPFRVNNYVLDHLIDWESVPDDPIFCLVFPRRAMMAPEDFDDIKGLSRHGASHSVLQDRIRAIWDGMNPHPGGQLTLNRPKLDGKELSGIQHQYPQTVLFFPSEGQFCHSYCTFCFRWAQFVPSAMPKFGDRDISALTKYLRAQPAVTDLLFTGGDPMVMPTKRLERYMTPLLEDETLQHVSSIRIGTKALTFWPHRFLNDVDSDELMRLFDAIVGAGKHLAIMAHFNHPRELESELCRRAIKRIQSTGAVIRSQGPILRTVNDSPDIWTEMWNAQINLGVIPYYMFVERNTGPYKYFKVPLVRCLEIFQESFRCKNLSGLAKTVRGPVMSCSPGKVQIQDAAMLDGKPRFLMQFIQARDPQLALRTFTAELDPDACWISDLKHNADWPDVDFTD